jgi:hypothetical protein
LPPFIAPEKIVDLNWGDMSTGNMEFTSYPNGGIKGIKAGMTGGAGGKHIAGCKGEGECDCPLHVLGCSGKGCKCADKHLNGCKGGAACDCAGKHESGCKGDESCACAMHISGC